jgi:putative IMPACT (imprinted ancient) family translation regulator
MERGYANEEEDSLHNGDDEGDNDDRQELYERSVADIEMIQAAYPDEISLSEWTRARLAHEIDHETRNCDPPRPPPSMSDVPLSFTLHLSGPDGRGTTTSTAAAPSSSTAQASLTMALPWGYPVTAGVQIVDYRSHSAEHKVRLDRVVRAVRAVSLECQQDKMEGAIACCAVALETWDTNFDGEKDHRRDENDDDSRSTSPTVDVVDDAAPSVYFSSKHDKKNLTRPERQRHYKWITGKPLVDKKSTFQAHVCLVYSEMEVREALHELLSSTSKIQRATHNMYAWRIVEAAAGVNNMGGDSTKRRNDHTTITPIVVRHDNDDDGEDGAGSKLAYLLDMRKDENVLVVVSRWYGGIQLGPKRFAHIVNVARELLLQVFTTRSDSQR